jgi:photosystem II stability/assembly factor-like uncharacterized protein
MRNQLARLIPIFVVALAMIPILEALAHLPDSELSPISPSLQSSETAAQRSIPVNPMIRKIGNIPTIEEKDFRNIRIEFISEKNGWLYAGGKLWRSDDGGANWLFVYDTSPESIWQVKFVDSRLGWMIASGKLYKTRDGGGTWTAFLQPIPSSMEGKLYAIGLVKGGLRAWVAGGIYMQVPKAKAGDEDEGPPSRYLSANMQRGLRGVIFCTEDGGATWRRQLLTPNWGLLTVLFVLDDEHAWAAGTAGSLYLQAKKWKPMEGGEIEREGASLVKSLDVEIGFPTYQPYSIFFLNSHAGWLSNSNGYLAVSSDAGKRWKDISPPIGAKNGLPVFFLRLFFTDQINGWAFGLDGGLYRTDDGGVSWQKQDSETQFSDVCFNDIGQGWAITREGLFYLNARLR